MSRGGLQDSMYQDILHCGDVTQLAMFNNKCVGAIGCRLQLKGNGRARLYILTLGVLAPYRGEGIGASRGNTSL
jgi:N-alpha-acetyltransferase 50